MGELSLEVADQSELRACWPLFIYEIEEALECVLNFNHGRPFDPICRVQLGLALRVTAARAGLQQ